MKTYDVECPICGTVNKNLYLQETEDGWNAVVAPERFMRTG